MKKILLLGGNGYIGSKFYNVCNKKYAITSIDLCLFGKDLGFSNKINFVNLDKDYINDFHVVICLAGHSSVPMCNWSPDRSWINNVDYFRDLCSKVNDSQILIYASSASVYGIGQNISVETTPIAFNSVNDYDLQKITVDLIANRYINKGKKILGLRFGTVNGASPNTRSELMLNSMTMSAIQSGKIYVKNGHIRRAILGINDLVRCFIFCIDKNLPSGQYNLSSFNSTVNQLSQTVSRLTNADIEFLPNDELVYDFAMTNEKFCSYADFKFTDTATNLVEEIIANNTKLTFDTRSNDRNFSEYIK